MDVEGPHAKLNVLKGAQGTLRHTRHLLIEFDADDYRQIWDRMADAGFEGGFVSWSKLQAVQDMFFSRDTDLMARLRADNYVRGMDVFERWSRLVEIDHTAYDSDLPDSSAGSGPPKAHAFLDEFELPVMRCGGFPSCKSAS